MRIIAYKAQNIPEATLITESTGEVISSNEPGRIFNFLLEDFEDTIRVAWDLDEFAALILRYFPLDLLSKLSRNKKCTLPPYRIFYIPSKLLSITHIPTRKQSTIYHLSQYYPALYEPDIDDMVSLGQELLHTLKKMNLEPTKLTSPVAIYDECILSRIDLPEAKDMPVDACELALRCSGKLWIEAHQLGYFPQTYDYDMNSAFPFVTQNLIDIRDCKWLHSPNYQPEAIYGYTNCNVEIYPHVNLSPIIYDGEEHLISPTGKFPSHLTKAELDFIRKHNIGQYHIKDGWWAIPKIPNPPKPLFYHITQLLKYKGKSPLHTLLAKTMSAGIYGKFGEEWTDSYGHHFNPCWYSEISTTVRLLVAEFAYAFNLHTENYSNLLHIAVDEVKTTEPIPIPKDNKRWKHAYQGHSLLISSGLCYTRLNKPKSLTIDQVVSLIEAHPSSAYYQTQVNRPITLGDAVGRKQPELIGKLANFRTSIDLTHPDHDRHFPALPKTGQDLLSNTYQSQPKQIERRP